MCVCVFVYFGLDRYLSAAMAIVYIGIEDNKPSRFVMSYKQTDKIILYNNCVRNNNVPNIIMSTLMSVFLFY